MSNFPFTETINNTIVVPSFPGAYIFSGSYASGSNNMMPIYNSIGKLQTANGQFICTYLSNNQFDLSNSIVYHALLSGPTNTTNVGAAVMPGFKLVVYRLIDFATPNTTASYNPSLIYEYDNSKGTDIVFYPRDIPLGSLGSVKLYCSNYPDNALREVFPYEEFTYTTQNGGVLHVQVPPLDENGSNLLGKRYEYIGSNATHHLLKFYDVGKIQYTGNGSIDVSVLVVGGGGSGGAPRNTNSDGNYSGSGGGGGGGFGTGTLRLTSNTIYDLSVGRGGIGMSGSSASFCGFPGGDTVITDTNGFTVTAYGGGPGAIDDPNNTSGGSTGGGMRSGGNYSSSSASNYLKKGTMVGGGTGSTMSFFGNIGGNYGNFAAGGGGGAGGLGQQGGQTGVSQNGYSYAGEGGTGGAGKTWTLTGGTIYAGGGGGGGMQYSGWSAYWKSGATGGGNYHGGGGGGTGTIGWNSNSAPGWSGCIIIGLPK